MGDGYGGAALGIVKVRDLRFERLGRRVRLCLLGGQHADAIVQFFCHQAGAHRRQRLIHRLSRVLIRFCSGALGVQLGQGGQRLNLGLDVLYPKVCLAQILKLLHRFLRPLESRRRIQHIVPEELVQAG